MKRDRDRGKSVVTDDDAKRNAWAEQPDAGMDELFAVLGYKVKSSDMADVAEKLEQLDQMAMAMGSNGASVLSSETVHYNPSDISGWVESILSEITTYNDVVPNQIESSSGNLISFSAGRLDPSDDEENFIYDDDLRSIPRGAIFGNGNAKRMKSSPRSDKNRSVLIDSQETGIRLVHTLIACAEAVDQENLKLAETLVKHVRILAAAQTGAMRKVATHFAEALARKIYKMYPMESIDSSYSDDVLQSHFYETAPYLKFAHFTANQAILEAFAGAARVHVVDFSLNQGMQWPVLMQALAVRKEGPPAFRLTGISSPQTEEVGLKLAQFAQEIGVEFEFRGVPAADLDTEMLELRSSDGETVAVNSVFELHRLLARPGAIDRVLSSIKAMNPKIVTFVEQEANHNSDGFLDRFNESLHYYSTMFDSLEPAGLEQINGHDLAMTELYLGRQIYNVVSCEGADRVERHEPLTRWRACLRSAGFSPVHLGSDAYKQVSLLLAHFTGGDGYGVQENDGCLMLSWHTRPLIATSAWRLAAAP